MRKSVFWFLGQSVSDWVLADLLGLLVRSVLRFFLFLGQSVSELQFNSMSDGCVSVRHLLKSLSLLQKLTISESQKAPDCKDRKMWLGCSGC
ncbi:hypothetical protein OROMI_009960 [Orobanche minor]